MSATPFIDARKWEASERRTALVRIDGEAIDPMRYIRAGSEIGSLL